MSIQWNNITSKDQIDTIAEESTTIPIVIFKHSTRCPISSMAMNRLERLWNDDSGIKPYYLDLIQYRDISNIIADKFNVIHQSPQVIVLKGGEVVHDNSHMGISVEDIESAAR